MFKKINDILAKWPMTIVGGAFLIASFFLPRIGMPWGEYLAWITVVICGIPLIYLAIWRIIYNNGISKISSALLISLAMIAAILIEDLFAAGEVAFIMAIGALLEEMTTERAKKGLKKLLDIAPETGRLIKDGIETIVPVKDITVGDTIRIFPGETIPVDGVITAGETSVDQSAMTGESLPVDKGPGDTVFSGTINRYGSIDYEVTKLGMDSSLQRLIKLVAEAEANQAPTQRIADRWASWLVPVALLIAIVAYIVTGNIVRAVTVMVVFCPCALVLATPTAIMAAIGQASKQGVIIKSGEALERMGKVNTVAFDKTGTLTYGNLLVSDIIPFADMSETSLLQLAASAEGRSEHPLGKAIKEAAVHRNLQLNDSETFKMWSGKGISASISGSKYYLGNEKLISDMGIDITENAKKSLNTLRHEGKASVIIVNNQTVLGIIALSDTLRPDSVEVVKKLTKMNIKTVLLTGDNQTSADHLAKQIGIASVFADLLPEEKVRSINTLKREGCVCMIGDGVNDAPALKIADVGVAMGAMGSDIAIEAADVALMSDDISKLPYLKWLSDTTVKTIRIAITLSMCINLIAVTLSVLGILTPTTGALVHNAGSCFVVFLAATFFMPHLPAT